MFVGEVLSGLIMGGLLDTGGVGFIYTQGSNVHSNLKSDYVFFLTIKFSMKHNTEPQWLQKKTKVSIAIVQEKKEKHLWLYQTHQTRIVPENAMDGLTVKENTNDLNTVPPPPKSTPENER